MGTVVYFYFNLTVCSHTVKKQTTWGSHFKMEFKMCLQWPVSLCINSALARFHATYSQYIISAGCLRQRTNWKEHKGVEQINPLSCRQDTKVSFLNYCLLNYIFSWVLRGSSVLIRQQSEHNSKSFLMIVNTQTQKHSQMVCSINNQIKNKLLQNINTSFIHS